MNYGIPQGHTTYPRLVDEIHHDQAVVYNNTGECNQAEHRKHAERTPHDDMPNDCPNHAERNDRHDDERLGIRMQWNRD